ncbi:Wadjet anti-phage system protein JetD domain-containing protein [Methylomonas methanica]|uniref:Wadjet protein JetD C-terminal domain-containing protein n=1 Tax=Methylomonas methanica TaxID=421 RepID=A0A177MZ41_METMH|nr:Wadjet anti-phage system protein JetD domain-containing protein [Methylomonas methanica]OAI10553.1 hypothetical protein A1332_23725 [Methylomonas methanica]
MDRPWGLLPSDIKELILKREWQNFTGLKARLLNDKPFPIRVGLKPPTGQLAVGDMEHFQKFIGQWRSFAAQHLIEWETRNYRVLSEQTLPKFFVLKNVQELIEFVGDGALKRSQIWETNMSPLLKVYPETYSALVKNLNTIETMNPADASLLPDLIKQLIPAMGTGKYLRALPLVGVDTKFLETYRFLITDILDKIHNNAVSNAGGLLKWLSCITKPTAWLTIRPLCEDTKARIGGFPVLQLSGDVLKQQALPAKNILVIENMESGLGLPSLPDTIAIFGGGKNVAWMEAVWLKSKNVAYWGDIDTWGLSILSDVRSKLSTIKVLMMDQKTLDDHKDRMVGERTSVNNLPKFLTDSEARIFSNLKNTDKLASRLEQERLSPDYIKSRLEAWIN